MKIKSSARSGRKTGIDYCFDIPSRNRIAAALLSVIPTFLGLLLALAHRSHAEELGIRAPENFVVTQFAGDELAHDIYSMTFDRLGRVVVAGARYIKTLHDDDGDGRADRATLFADKPVSGAHGLLCIGENLYATGDNGIWKFTDADGDGIADAPPEKWVEGLLHSEHGCNGLVLGPDGWIYVVCGNDAGVNEKFATTPDSPVLKPNCGAVLRFSPDGRESEIVAHGFRNPYDLCFHPHGNLFTVDADGERDHHLPWYAPNRLFDVATGMHHGWVLQGWQWSWNRPESYFDNVERCAEIGRGSPTGMLCYRHTQFPQKYRDGIFSACWTLGRVYHYPLTPRGSTFDGKVETFLETTGETGFAPVDMAVGPEGAMYVAIGGRRTRGSVFKVSYAGELIADEREPKTALERVLAAPQPLDAWSREKWKPAVGPMKDSELELAVCDENLPIAWRMRAIEIMCERVAPLRQETMRTLLIDENSKLAARAAWHLGRIGDSAVNAPLLALATERNSEIVQRSAWEALINLAPPKSFDLQPHWDAISDRRTRAARFLAVARGWDPVKEGDEFASHVEAFDSTEMLWLTHFRQQRVVSKTDWRSYYTFPLGFKPENLSLNEQADLLRLNMITMGDIATDPADKERLAGYAFARKGVQAEKRPFAEDRANESRRRLAEDLAKAFPKLDRSLWPEAARLAAMTESTATVSLIAPLSTALTADSSPVDDIHYLMCLSQMPGERTEVARRNIAAGIAGLDAKMKVRSWYPSRNWPDRVGETFAALAGHDAALPQAVIDHVAFNSPSQAFLFIRLPEHQAAAARKILRSIKQSDEELPWTTELVTLVSSLPDDEKLPALRGAWEEFSIQDAIVLQLVKSPAREDRARFVEALASIDPSVVAQVAEALQSLKLEPSEAELMAAVRALRHSCFAPPNRIARQALMQLLGSWAGMEFGIKEKGDDHFGRYRPVFAWFEESHPKLAEQLRTASGDAASWQTRLAKIDWNQGNAERGKLAYEKRNCVKCHAGSSPLGPDLAGAAGRLSREDLFTAIVDPSKDVAPLYQATQIATGSGKVYFGLVVYESPDGTLLTTGPETTIRIAGDEITLMRKSRLSLMPTGLLEMAEDAELADLYAYLQTLKGK